MQLKLTEMPQQQSRIFTQLRGPTHMAGSSIPLGTTHILTVTEIPSFFVLYQFFPPMSFCSWVQTRVLRYI